VTSKQLTCDFETKLNSSTEQMQLMETKHSDVMFALQNEISILNRTLQDEKSKLIEKEAVWAKESDSMNRELKDCRESFSVESSRLLAEIEDLKRSLDVELGNLEEAHMQNKEVSYNSDDFLVHFALAQRTVYKPRNGASSAERGIRSQTFTIKK
jgi:hypothetical protein